MIDREAFQSYYSRKLLQTNSSSSSSSFDTSQPSFIALLCIVSILTVAFVITVIILCYRYYSHRERKNKSRHKRRKKFQRISSTQNNNQQLNVPISVTPTSASSYSVRSSENLFPNQYRQPSSINTLPSCRLEQPIIDAYLNDLNSFQPTSMDVNQLNSYLFIDLHSTSSETFPENISKQFTNKIMINNDNRSIESENQRNSRYYLKHQQQHRSTLTSKRLQNSRFLVRERSLPNNLSKLPQLREATTRKQRHSYELDDTNNSSMTIVNPDVQSTITSTSTDDYDDSHAYHVNQNQIMQTIKEEKPFIDHRDFSPRYEQEPFFFEIVSTVRDDYSDIQIPYKSSPMIGNRITYIDDSIIV